ncbi:V-set and immunoglobulin domain-containing protein 10-like [Paroedura picta]|uniref:V-set and immunoglobulin domain-containing protein 10-like n=1 Tax=Paroedura picta TaxID=143630 RepID=UPI00405696A0
MVCSGRKVRRVQGLKRKRLWSKEGPECQPEDCAGRDQGAVQERRWTALRERQRWGPLAMGTAPRPTLDPSHHRVDGLQGGTVSLRVLIGSFQRVAQIEWKFRPPAGPTLAIADVTNGKLERPNPGDRFGQRLETAGEATLRIAELELEDGGVYTARVRLASAVVQEHSFNCTVHRPVPEPQIRHRVTSQTAEGCNVTLQCLPPAQGGSSVSWGSGIPPSILEGRSDWYRLSAEGTDLHLSWGPGSSSSTFTCLLSSPVEQKAASLDLLSICQSAEPLPDPRIRAQLVSKTTEGCNVTLQCLAPGPGSFNISWESGKFQLGALQEGSERHRLSAEGPDLRLSWRFPSSDATFTCLVSNPVDQKKASLDLASICQSEGACRCLSWVRVAMLVGLLGQILTVASLDILERTGREQNGAAAGAMA